jgi:hypothetical protein
MPTKVHGLDEKINLAGRITTIREQHAAGKVRTFRGGSGPTLDKEPFSHWVEIEKGDANTEGFHISASDFAILRGERRQV